MRALHRKLLRDLVAMRGQVLAIALVLMAGVAMFIAYFSLFDSLQYTRATYYADYRFADLFAAAKRVPQSVAARLAGIDGVAAVETRVVVDVTLDLEDDIEPATGRLISMSFPRERPLNDVFLRRGRDPAPGRPDEALVGEAFAVARRLELGDRIAVIVNGRRRELQVVGIALSPEYVYSIRTGDLLPDPGRFGVFWVERESLATAFDMEGAFNDVTMALAPGASEPAVIDEVERQLDPYGGLGVVPRRLQTSNWFLDSELQQLQTAGVFVPAIFLLVAAFLLNVSLNRLVATQREQIAALKAVGYTNGELARHFMAWSLCVSIVGVVFGIAAGAWLGRSMTAMYNDYFRFPELFYGVSPGYMLAALAIGVSAALIGAISAVRGVTKLAPAEAMRPAAPERFHHTWFERAWLRRGLSPVARMILRNTARQPIRTLLSATGVGLAVAILVVGLFFVDVIEFLLRVQFEVAQRQDVTVTFTRPLSAGASFELSSLPGVLAVEPMRAVPVRISHGLRNRVTAITGLPAEPSLGRLIDGSLRPIAVPASGLAMSTSLAGALDVRAGDEVGIEVLEGTRPALTVPVRRLIDEFMGGGIYMERAALGRLLGEGGTISGALLRVDQAAEADLYRRLRELPAVAGVALKRAAVQSFRDTIAQNMLVLVFFNLLFAGIICYGVAYNAARIVLSERGRDLASLRVIGFSKAEVSTILLGELVVIVAIAIPLGLLLGQAFGTLLVSAMESEVYRFPLVITPRTRLFAVVVVVLSVAISGMMVRRRVDRLDLVGVLKTRE